MVKRDRRSAIRSSFIGLKRAPKTAWELGILFVLLLVVFSPNIVQFMTGIAPLIPAPRAAFVYPLWAGSTNYNLTAIAGQSFESLFSASYNMSVWTLFGAAGNMSSASYSIQLGIAPLVSVLPTELDWSQLSVNPESPTVWGQGKPYTFSIIWSVPAGRTIKTVYFDIRNSAGGIVNTTTFPGSGESQFFSKTLTNLNVGTYTFTWSAVDSADFPKSTPSQTYEITSGLVPSENFTIPSSPSYSLGAAYEFHVTWNGAVSSVKLEFAGTNYTADVVHITDDGYRANKTFVNLPAGAYNYKWWANDTSGQWSSTFSAIYNVTRTVTTITLGLCDAGYAICADGNKNYISVGQIYLKADLNAPKKVCINVTNAQGSPVSSACEPGYTGHLTTSPYISQSGAYYVTAYFVGDANYTESVASHVALVAVTDTAYPNWTSQTENATTIEQGQTIALRASWSDDVMLSNATLVTNETGVWANKTDVYGSPMTINMKNKLVSFTWQNPSIENATIGWRIRACDVMNKCNETGNMTFNVTPACVHANPTVVAWPAIQTGAAGVMLTYYVNVTNEDSSTCASASFDSEVYVPVSWNEDYNIPATSMSPGQTITGTFRVTPSDTVTMDDYDVTLKILRVGDPTSWTNASVIYRVVADNPPTVSDAKQNKSATAFDRSINLSATCTDDIGLDQAMLATNEFGEWINWTDGSTHDSPKTLNGKSSPVEFTWQRVAGLPPIGTTVSWQIWCMDTAGNWSSGPVMSFKVVDYDTADGQAGEPKDCIISDVELGWAVDEYHAVPPRYDIGQLYTTMGNWYYGITGYC